MKNVIYASAFAALSLLAVGCSKDNPFEGPAAGMGGFDPAALSLEVSAAENLVRAAAPDVNDVTVSFFKEGNSVPVYSVRYGDMNEVVSLPVGNYHVEATLGENPVADWESPYYAGVSSDFAVESGKTVTEIDPVVCSLSNVKVTVIFDSSLLSAMSPESSVAVRVGQSGLMEFTPADADRSAFFRYDPNSDAESRNTLVATFSGEIKGSAVSQSKTYDNVAPGNHYRITFSLRSPGATQGDADAEIVVDASLETVDVNGNVTVDDELLADDSRPTEDGDDNPDPGPGTDPEPSNGPAVSLSAGLSETDFNVVTDGMECVIYVTSETGFTAFSVDIISDVLTPDELSGVGLTDHLDLVNPGEYQDALGGLGFPVNIGGEKYCECKITDFLPLLVMASAGKQADHIFRLTITDASGTTVKELKLRTL